MDPIAGTSSTWRSVQHPLRDLESALLGIAAQPPSSLLEDLERDAFGLARVVDRVLTDPTAELLILMDQLEELFTLVDDDERDRSLELIRAAVEAPGQSRPSRRHAPRGLLRPATVRARVRRAARGTDRGDHADVTRAVRACDRRAGGAGRPRGRIWPRRGDGDRRCGATRRAAPPAISRSRSSPTSLMAGSPSIVTGGSAGSREPLPVVQSSSTERWMPRDGTPAISCSSGW